LIFVPQALSYIHRAYRTPVAWLKKKAILRQRKRLLRTKQNFFSKCSTQFWSLFIEDDFWNESNELSNELPENVEFVVIRTNSKGEPEKAVPLWRASANEKSSLSIKAMAGPQTTDLPDFTGKLSKPRSRDSVTSGVSIGSQSTAWDTDFDDDDENYEATSPISNLSENFNVFQRRSWTWDQHDLNVQSSPQISRRNSRVQHLRFQNSGDWEPLPAINDIPDLRISCDSHK
ncbi:hypothetical protein HK096_000658, partial [Nowakowskiella sp. JEL0078]